jgi:phosphoribosylanthranilate isomerase
MDTHTPNPLHIKICGITRLEDARFASGALADYLGFIATPASPRHMTPEKVKEILAWVHGPKSVAVFVDQPLDEVTDYLTASGVDMAQLHGEESPAYCALVGVPVIKAFRVMADQTTDDLVRMAAPYVGAADYLLFDTYKSGQAGGTGEAFDWRVMRGFDVGIPYFVSGGLHAGNVAAVVEGLHPYGVDASSRLESSPGVKDLPTVATFFETLAPYRDA